MLRKCAFVLAVVGAGLMAGCGSDDDKTSSAGGSEAKAAKVALLTYGYQDYQRAEEEGIKEAIGPDGGSIKVFNYAFDPQKMQQQCADIVSSKRYNVMILTPISAETAEGCVSLARAAKIPVVAMGGVSGKDADKIEPQIEGIVGSVVSPRTKGGEDLAAVTKAACGDKDPCEVIADTIPSDPLGEAVLDALKATPGIKIVQKINTNYDPTAMQKIAPDVIGANPGADVLVALSDAQVLAAVQAVKDAGLTGKLRLVAAGASTLAKKAIQDGTMFGTLGLWPRQHGKLAGTMAVQALNGKPVDPLGVDETSVDEPSLVTPDNIDQFTPEYGPGA